MAGERDAADDPAIWVNPWDRSQSLVIGTDKSAKNLEVYDLTGHRLQRIPDANGSVNNVDVRYGFPLDGEYVDIVVDRRRRHHRLQDRPLHPPARRRHRPDDPTPPTAPGGSASTAATSRACSTPSPSRSTTGWSSSSSCSTTGSARSTPAPVRGPWDIHPEPVVVEDGEIEACVVDDRHRRLLRRRAGRRRLALRRRADRLDAAADAGGLHLPRQRRGPGARHRGHRRHPRRLRQLPPGLVAGRQLVRASTASTRWRCPTRCSASSGSPAAPSRRLQHHRRPRRHLAVARARSSPTACSSARTTRTAAPGRSATRTSSSCPWSRSSPGSTPTSCSRSRRVGLRACRPRRRRTGPAGSRALRRPTRSSSRPVHTAIARPRPAKRRHRERLPPVGGRVVGRAAGV